MLITALRTMAWDTPAALQQPANRIRTVCRPGLTGAVKVYDTIRDKPAVECSLGSQTTGTVGAVAKYGNCAWPDIGTLFSDAWNTTWLSSGSAIALKCTTTQVPTTT